MKKVEFEKIIVRNFLSYGDEPVELAFKQGINYVTGYNKDQKSFNGVGKTTLLVESLSFVLFGKTYRKINQGIIKNYENNSKNECSVEVFFSINEDKYHIIRSISPNKLIRWKNGEDKTRTIPETTKDILDDLGITKEIFVNIMVMTNDNSSAFLAQDTPLKTKFIEGIIGLEVFSKMFELTNTSYKDISKTVVADEIKLAELIKSIENDKKYESIENDKKLKAIAEHEALIAQLKQVQPIDNSTDIENIQIQIVKLEEEIENHQAKVQKGLIKQSKINTELKAEMVKWKEMDNKLSICPTCKKPLEEHDTTEIDKEKAILQAKIDKIKGELAKLSGAIEKVQTHIAENKKNKTTLSAKLTILLSEQSRFEKSQDKISNLEADLRNIRECVNPFSEKVKEGEEKRDALSKRLEKIKSKSRIEEAKKFVASPNGVKTIIIKKIINHFNRRFNFYLKRLNSACSCEFDEFFEEKLFNKKGKEINYGNLSGGEKKRVDFALLFTFRDIRRLQSGISINISVFDELFDGAMDSQALSAVIELLKEMADANNESYYIISHRPDAIDLHECNVIRLEKEHGVTRIVSN